MIEDAKILFNKAEKDLHLAKHLIYEDEEFIEAICFHCQQAAEKYLKSYLSYNNKEIKRTHEVIDIIKDCEQLDVEFIKLNEIETGKLTRYAVNLRYDDIPFITIEDANEALYVAEQVRSFIILKIPELLADKKIN